MEAEVTVSGPLRRRGDDNAILFAEHHWSGMVLEPSPTSIEYLATAL